MLVNVCIGLPKCGACIGLDMDRPFADASKTINNVIMCPTIDIWSGGFDVGVLFDLS